MYLLLTGNANLHVALLNPWTGIVEEPALYWYSWKNKLFTGTAKCFMCITPVLIPSSPGVVQGQKVHVSNTMYITGWHWPGPGF